MKSPALGQVCLCNLRGVPGAGCVVEFPVHDGRPPTLTRFNSNRERKGLASAKIPLGPIQLWWVGARADRHHEQEVSVASGDPPTMGFYR